MTWYNAISGYDLVTGWGSPNGQNFINALAGPLVPGFWLTTSPSSLGIYQGKSGTTTVSVTDADGFTGTVSLAASGLPAGVTASFNPTSTSGTSDLVLTADSTATAGTTTITISGTSGSMTATTQVAVTVNPPETSLPPAGEFGSVNVGSTGSQTAITLTILTAGTINNIVVLTKGSPNLDFTDASGGSCAVGTAYAANATCTVNVDFTPKYAGTRDGAVVLTDASGNQLGVAYLQGTGVGPQTTFTPGSETTIGSGFASPEGVAILGDGSAYVTDYGNSTTASGLYLETLSNGTYTQTKTNCTFSTPAGVAVDGGGTVYVADSGAGVLYKVSIINGNCTQTAIGSNLGQPRGVAVDGSGNIYVTDIYGEVFEEALQADGSYVQSTIGNGWITPVGIAVDGKGNVYVADDSIPGVFKETPSGGDYIQTSVSGGWTAPSGVAVDSAGNIYVSDPGDAIYNGGLIPAGVYEELASGENYIQTPIGGGWTLPQGLAVDAAGNVMVADQIRGVYKEDLSDPPQLAFANAASDAISSDSPKTVTVSNQGTAALSFSAISYPADFPEAGSNSGDCTPGTPLSAGQNCTLTIEFLPTASLGGNSSLAIDESVAITTNNLNVSAAQQVVPVTGTEVLPGGTVNLDVSANPSTAGNSITFTATVSGAAGGPTPTGTVTFYDGTTALSASMSVTNGVATYATASLAAGTHSISASYSGDTNYVVSSSNTITETILAAPGVEPISTTNFGNLDVGNTSSPTPLTITFTQSETLGTIAVLTQGAPNLDYTNSGGGTCTVGNAYSANATCTVNVEFSPKYSGARNGAVVLRDNNGNVIGTGYLEGTGVAPQVEFLTGALTTLSQYVGYLHGIAVDGGGGRYIANSAVLPASGLAPGIYGPNQNITGASLTCPYGVALDAAGNVYVADSGSHAVYKETPVNGSYIRTAIGYGFAAPEGVAVDSDGNVYVADYGNGVDPGAVYEETLSNGGYTQAKIPCTFISPDAIAVDSSGDIFVADSANGTGTAAVYKLTPSSGTYSQIAIGSGWVTPAGVTVDGNGNVFVTDDAYDLGNGFVAEETPQPDGTYDQSIIIDSASIPDPSGIAVDSKENKYITDDLTGNVYELDVADPPSLSFAATPYDQTSSDSPKTVTVQNIGNAVMTFSSVSYPTDFPESSGISTDCTTQTSLQVDSNCTLTIGFTPNTPLSSTQSKALSESLTIASNALGTNTQNIPVAGTEVAPVATVTVTAPENVFEAGGAATFAATVTGQSGLPVPTGTVTFSSVAQGTNSSTALGTTTLNSNGTATFSTSSLAAGWYGISATYSGDQNYASVTSSLFLVDIEAASTIGTENVGSASRISVTVSFASHTTLGGITVLTSGMPNLDFTNAGGGTCAVGSRYSSKATCTVNISFKPSVSGARHGALELTDSSGNLIETIYLLGTGIGPQVVFEPATTTALFTESSTPCAQTVDSRGDIYISLSTSSGTCGPVTKWTLSNGSYVQSTVPSSALSGQVSLAVDGAGNVYIADTGNGRVLKETLFNGAYSESVIASGLNSPRMVKVDGNGDVFFIATYYATPGPYLVVEEEIPSPFGIYSLNNISLYNYGSLDATGFEVDDDGHAYVSAHYYYAGAYLPQLSVLEVTVATFAINEFGFAANSSLDFIDANGSLYVTSPGVTYRVTLGLLGTVVSIPASAWGIDGSGNVYRTIDNVVTKETFSTPPSLRFAQTGVGATSSDSPKTATMENVGNAPLTFSTPSTGTNPSISANFALDPSSTCPQVATSGSPSVLPMNGICNYAVNFSPTKTGTISGSLIATDNALNAAGGTQTIPLNGNGTSGNAVLAKLMIGPNGVPQVTIVPDQISTGASGSGQVWVDTTHKTYIQGGVFLQEDSQGQATCNLYGQTQLVSNHPPTLGSLYLSTVNYAIPGCGTKLFPFQVARYTWGAEHSVAGDHFTLDYTAINSTSGDLSATYYPIATLARISLSPAQLSGSGTNPALTATATLTNPPVYAFGYDWKIVGGNGAIVFPNGQETISSTTNSIPVEEPNPTASSVPFTIEVGARYSSSGNPKPTNPDNDPLLYGPTNDVFCGTPTITSISPNVWFAGQTYNVTITGTGFNPTNSQSCPLSNVSIAMSNGETVASTVNSVTPTQISLTVTPASTDSTEGATVAVTGEQVAVPNVDVLGAPVISWASDPNGNSPPISGPSAKTQQAVVGQSLYLTTTPTATDLSALPVPLTFSTTTPTAWSLSGGTNIGGYIANSGSADVTPLKLDTSNVTFYSVYAATGVTATYSYCVTGYSTCPTAIATFDVQGVTGIMETSFPTNGDPYIDYFEGCTSGTEAFPGAYFMTFGNLSGSVPVCQGNTPYGPPPGVSFSALTQGPGSGAFYFVQIINSDTYGLSGTSGGETCTATYGNDGLDTTFPYLGQNGLTTAADAPFFEISGYTSGNRQFDANMYLLWKSSLADSIYVPVGYQEWSFSISATQSNGQWQTGQAQTAGSGGAVGAYEPSLSTQPHSGYPTWGGTSTFTCTPN